jgi:Glycosyl transferase family 2
VRYTVVCSVRNEGPFLVEWITWYRLLGFTDIVIVTNDCTDHSPALLDALGVYRWCTHIIRDIPDGKRICATKLEHAHATEQVQKADWVLVCDVDEFLVIHRGMGRISDLIESPSEPFLGMSINWRVFGTSGHAKWQDGLVHRQFTHAAELANPSSNWVKSIASHSDWFARLAEHGPKNLRLKRAGKAWGAPGMRWVNSAGVDVPTWQPNGDYLRRLPKGLVTHDVAQMNHYMIRSEESFSLKKGQLSAVAGKDRYTDEFMVKFDRNECEDTSAFRYSAAFDDLFAQAMALPNVRRLHHLCCADYVARIAEKTGKSPDVDPRYHAHLDAAAQ